MLAEPTTVPAVSEETPTIATEETTTDSVAVSDTADAAPNSEDKVASSRRVLVRQSSSQITSFIYFAFSINPPGSRNSKRKC